MVALFVFLFLFVVAGVVAAMDGRPATYDRSWSIGKLLDR